jgi:hypothetical protein
MKHTISIEQTERTSKDWTIREYKEQGMHNTKHYLVNMPNPLVKQTLCIILDTNMRPKTWKEIASGKLFIINRQRNVHSSQQGHADVKPAREHYEVLQVVELLCSMVEGQKQSAADL